jgi:hypothetical protein
MGSKYQPVKGDEKFQEVLFDARRASTSTSDDTLLEDEEDARLTQPRSRMSGRWMWLVHAVLLSLSFTMFVSSFFQKPSTLQHVKQFSAYCEQNSIFPKATKLTVVSLAPAAEAVEYQKVRFNATMGEGSPYVGSGPEVDKAWHAISYDSKLLLKAHPDGQC